MKMKKAFTAILTGVALLIIGGCAGTSEKVMKSPPVQEVKITVASANDSAVMIDTVAEDELWKEELSHMTFVTKDAAYIKLFSALGTSDATNLWQDVQLIKNNTDIRDINIYINSPGGNAFGGLALADQIMTAQEDFNITAYASGIVASAAVPVLAVCEHAYAAKGTILMVHEAALFKWPGRETASDIRAQNELMALLQDRYLNMLVDNSNLTLEEWRALESRTTWFTAQKALEMGIIDGIK